MGSAFNQSVRNSFSKSFTSAHFPLFGPRWLEALATDGLSVGKDAACLSLLFCIQNMIVLAGTPKVEAKSGLHT